MSIVAWYRDFSNDEVTARTLSDKSGNGNNGVLQQQAAIVAVAGKGRVISFPAGVTSAAQIPDSPGLSPVAAVSVGAWIYRLDNSAAMVVNKDQSYRLRFPDTSGKPAFEVFIGGSWRSAISNVAVPTQQWVFLQGSYDGLSLRLFQHGSERGLLPQSGMINDSVAPLLLGAPDQFRGTIGEVIVKNSGVMLTEHKADLARWLKKETHDIIELLQIKVPGNPINLCTYHQSITVSVYN
jgi:hypothetical protein